MENIPPEDACYARLETDAGQCGYLRTIVLIIYTCRAYRYRQPDFALSWIIVGVNAIR